MLLLSQLVIVDLYHYHVENKMKNTLTTTDLDSWPSFSISVESRNLTFPGPFEGITTTLCKLSYPSNDLILWSKTSKAKGHMYVRDILLRKKWFCFRFCPNYLHPPPLPQIWTTCTTIFRRWNSRFESQIRTQNTIYIQPKKTVQRQDDDTTWSTEGGQGKHLDGRLARCNSPWNQKWFFWSHWKFASILFLFHFQLLASKL